MSCDLLHWHFFVCRLKDLYRQITYCTVLILLFSNIVRLLYLCIHAYYNLGSNTNPNLQISKLGELLHRLETMGIFFAEFFPTRLLFCCRCKKSRIINYGHMFRHLFPEKPGDNQKFPTRIQCHSFIPYGQSHNWQTHYFRYLWIFGGF